MIVADVKQTVTIDEFIHVQAVPASTWVIVHNMDCHPGVTVIDSGNSQVEGDVTYNTLNQVTIEFGSSFSGRAILR